MSRISRLLVPVTALALVVLVGTPVRSAPAMGPTQVKSAMNARMKNTKKKLDAVKIAANLVVNGSSRQLKTKSGKLVKVEEADPPNAGPAIPAAASTEPSEIAKYKAYYDSPSAEPTAADPNGPNVAARDHTSLQTPVKNQMNRGTCMAFATAAAMESTLRAKKSVTADISEEHLYKLVKDSVQKNCNSDGTNYAGLLNALSGKRMCSETDLPYQAAPSTCTLTAACTANAIYTINRSVFIPRAPATTGSGFWAGNARLVEVFLDAGYDLAGSFYLAGNGWSDDADTGVIDVELKSDGTPADAWGSHAVEIVGYNRTQGYFIIKNSWGADWGRSGYARISYDYLQTYSKDHVVMLEVGNMPQVAAVQTTLPLTPAPNNPPVRAR